MQYFGNLENDLKVKLKQTLPTFPESHDVFVQLCEAVEDSSNALGNAENEKENLLKQQPIHQEKVNEAEEKIEAAKRTLEENYGVLKDIVAVALKEKELEDFCSASFNDDDLVQYTAIVTAGSKRLDSWCSKGEQEKSQCLSLFNDVNLLRRFLESGGPRGGGFIKAFEIYLAIHPLDEDNPVLQRLKLAVALELAGDIPVKVAKNEIDPLERYRHYERAFLEGELDPAFSQFGVWELRYSIDSDATNDELEWGRTSLRNYRPDLVLNDAPQWRYVQIVRTDVSYNKPDWYKDTRSYDQILSGGGMCGPRAWYGRFILKCFGIPTWGCQQPGHAALVRWTKDGWTVCLGCGIHKSHWENKCGNYFLLETQARYALANEGEYMRQISRLQWLGDFYGEKGGRAIEGKAIPKRDYPWHSLAFMKMKQLASMDSSTSKVLYERSGPEETILERIANKPELLEEITKDGETGWITIPATSCCRPKEQNKNVLFLKSFLGGKQVYLSNDGELEYTLPSEFLSTAVTKYNLTCNICTVHRREEHLRLKIGGNVYEIPVPYTMGQWAETEPVEIELGGCNANFTIVRQAAAQGFSIKNFTLAPA